MKTKFNKNNIFILTLLFTIASLIYFFLMEEYVKKSEKNFLNEIKKEALLLIKNEKIDLLELSKHLSNEKNIVNILMSKEYKKFYQKNIVKLPNSYLKYKDIKIHIVDKDMINRYLSWTKKGLNESVQKARKDLLQIYKDPHPTHNISVGKFDMTLKAIDPIYDKNGNFLGIIEVIKNLNFVAKELLKNDIKSLVLIDKRYKKQLKYLLSKKYIQNYPISVSTLDKDMLSYLYKQNIKKIIIDKGYRYVTKKGNLIEGYYLISFPIKATDTNKPIGYMLLFIKDSYHLAILEILLYVVYIAIGFLFLLLTIVAYKEYRENIDLIKNLNSIVKKEMEKRVFLTYHDSTTKAYNKTKFYEDLKSNLNKKAIMLNIKNFSKINESFGFDTGDKILLICAKRLKRLLERDIYRIGSDEFVLFSQNVKQDIKRINKKFIEEPVILYNDKTNLNISFTYGVINCDTDRVISKLSLTTKEAKKYPFSLFLFYRDKFHKYNIDFMEMNSIIYDAIFKQNFAKIIPFFQPIYNNETLKIEKYESLVRLKNGSTIYTPYHFLQNVQDSGFMYKMTEIMVEESLKYISNLDKPVDISLNITEEDLNTRKIKFLLLEMSQKYHISPSRITLEILEEITTIGTKNNIKQLKELKKEGFKIALDDFGVKYSNFERLAEIDMDFIKIDGKYIKDILTNPKSSQIVQAITDFAHTLGIKVVAEFVENKEIYLILKELGVDYSQGYYFAKPKETI